MSTRSLAARRRQVTRTAITVGVMALVLGVLMAALISRSLARRIGAIAKAATSVAAGNLEQRPVEDRAGDEIGAMSRAFNAMLAQLRVLIRRIQAQAAVETERRIEQHTQALNVRNMDMQLVLDNVEQGFLTTDRQGVLQGA